MARFRPIPNDAFGSTSTALLERLKALQSTADPLLVAIDGAGGSGKSTLANWLRDQLLQCTVVRMDDFYRPMDAHARESLTPQQGVERYFDWQRLEGSVLRPLRNRSLASYQRYDWKTGQLCDRIKVAPAGVVLVEGIYTLRSELRALYHLSVFLDVPERVRLKRLFARGENTEFWIRRWAAAEESYLKTERPMDHADVVIRN
jgi:uridine kinase